MLLVKDGASYVAVRRLVEIMGQVWGGPCGEKGFSVRTADRVDFGFHVERAFEYRRDFRMLGSLE